MSGIFITGTDTGIGKTVVTTAILSILRAGGLNAWPMKPVHSGCKVVGRRLLPDDVTFATRALDITIPDDAENAVVPYRFRHACSPHLAAQLANTTISIPHVLACARKLQRMADAIVVEGAGGLMVPITSQCLVLDLIVKMRLPVLLVARPVLGTLNHTLLSLRCLQDAGVTLLGVVLNATSPTSKRTAYIEADNVKIIKKLGKVPVFGPLPYVRQLAGHPERWSRYQHELTMPLPTAAQLIRWMKQS